MMWLGDRPGDNWIRAGGPQGTLTQSDEDTAKAFDWRVVKRLLAYIIPFKLHAFIGLGAMFLLQAMHLVQPLLEGMAIDRVIEDDTDGLLVLCGVYLGSLFLTWMAQYLQVYQMTWVGQHVLYHIASDMFVKIMRLSLSFFDKNETGRIMSRVQSDVNVLQQLLSSGIIGTVGNMVSLIGIIIFMFLLDWKLAALACSVLPIGIIGLLVWQQYARRSFRNARAAISRVSADLQENVSGVRVIQSLGREGQNYDQFAEGNRLNMKANLDATIVGTLTVPMIEFVSALAMALVIFFGGSMVLNGSMSIGILYAFIRYVTRFFDPIRMLTQEYNQLQRATVAGERIFEVLDLEEEIQDPPDAIELPPIEGRITYENVSFGYVPGLDVLKEFDLDIKPGERIAFVGQTGAGKSTIISLLLRFYDVTGGRILVDGHDIRDVTMESLRRQIGIVLQEPVLFSGTIADNIRYARQDASDEEVEAAALAVGADELIRRLEKGYQTPVNERGVGLSIGERQLIAFARALFAGPRILILDEATASLDTSTERIVQGAIRNLTEDRTSLIVAHRLSTIRDADRIVVLENGRIVEVGDHQTLLDLQGTYHRLYSLGFKQAPAAEAASPS